MKPYYEQDGIAIYHGDGRDIAPRLKFQSLIVDPVWPNSTATIVGIDRAYELFEEIIGALPQGVERAAIHLGCDSDPLFLMPMMMRTSLQFFRVAWLEYVRPRNTRSFHRHRLER